MLITWCQVSLGWGWGGGGSTRNEEWGVFISLLIYCVRKTCLYTDARNYVKKNHLTFHKLPKVIVIFSGCFPFFWHLYTLPTYWPRREKKVTRSWFMTFSSLTTIIIYEILEIITISSSHCLQWSVKISWFLIKWPYSWTANTVSFIILS